MAAPLAPAGARPSAETGGASAGTSTSVGTLTPDLAASRKSPGTVGRTARATAARHPEVLVPPERAEAVQRLLRIIAEKRIELPPAEPSIPMPPEAVQVSPLVVEPITIPAIEGRGGVTPTVRGL